VPERLARIIIPASTINDGGAAFEKPGTNLPLAGKGIDRRAKVSDLPFGFDCCFSILGM